MEWMPILSKVIEAILIAILPPLAVVLVSVVLAYAKKLWADLKQRYPSVTDLVEQAAVFAVQAAEQAGAADLIKDKKEYAIQIAEAWLVANHITTDIDLIDAAIEKAVLELFNSDEKPTGYEGVG
jgi:hypothetical protein